VAQVAETGAGRTEKVDALRRLAKVEARLST
jgi:hypothetical protein